MPKRSLVSDIPAGDGKLVIPAEGEFGSDIPAGDGKLVNLFLRCNVQCLCHDVPEQSELGFGDDDVLVLLHGAHAAVAIHHCKQQ
jgi:hypothetical protein